MSYAHVTDDTIDYVGALPEIWNDGTRDWDLRPDDITPEQLAEIGWYEVVRVQRPPDTETTTHDESVTLVDGVPTQTWTEREWTTEELEVQDREEEHAATKSRVALIIDELQAEKARVQPAIDASNATINSSPAAYIKDNARAAKRIADAAIDLAKYVDGR
jgi:hypothetical protein